MLHTNHADYRANERNIDQRLVNVVHTFGKRVPGCKDRFILKQDDIPNDFINSASPALRAHIQHQLPIVAVIAERDVGYVLISVWHPTERIRRKRGHNYDASKRAKLRRIA